MSAPRDFYSQIINNAAIELGNYRWFGNENTIDSIVFCAAPYKNLNYKQF